MSDVPRDSDREESLSPDKDEETGTPVGGVPDDPSDDPAAYGEEDEDEATAAPDDVAQSSADGNDSGSNDSGSNAPDSHAPDDNNDPADGIDHTPGGDVQSGSGDDSGGNGPGGDGHDQEPPSDNSDDSGKDADREEDADPKLHEMTLLDHMEELRIRMTRCVIGAIVGFLACYAFSQQMFDLLVLPLVNVLPEGSSLIFTALPEAFFTYLKVSFVAGIFLTSPYTFYQIWAFVAPGLYQEERKWMVPIALISAIFFVSGAMFGYFVVFPFAFQFFMDFGTELIRPMPSLKEYLSFALKLLFAFGLTFELPLFIFFLSRLGIVDAPLLRRIRKYAILGAFIFSAILTPPDVVSQVLMAGPILVLYEGSIFVALFFGKKKKTEEDEDAEDQESEEKNTGNTETE